MREAHDVFPLLDFAISKAAPLLPHQAFMLHSLFSLGLKAGRWRRSICPSYERKLDYSKLYDAWSPPIENSYVEE